ncbi:MULTISPECIES: hypothetical protein [Limnospira]|nr:hypothetical protein [Limnospira indica]
MFLEVRRSHRVGWVEVRNPTPTSLSGEVKRSHFLKGDLMYFTLQ